MAQVIYTPGSRWLHAHQDYCSAERWEEFCKDLPGEVWEESDAMSEIDRLNAEHYQRGVAFPVIEAEWDEALNMLPPSRWVNYGPSESFMVPEPITGILYTFYVRVGGNRYRVNHDVGTSHWDLVKACQP